ncbi:MAG: hypothetical protein ABFS16_13865 [Bacteroidota bacterium]
MYRIIILFIALFAVACSAQKQLQKSYIGKPVLELEETLGKPKTVFNQDGGKMYIFERVEKLKSTEISQHKLTLDPMVSPEVTKTERYYVSVKDGIIVKIKAEEAYER